MTTKKKITDIYREKIVSRKERNQSGEVEPVERAFRLNRPVDTLSAPRRLLNFIIDNIFICFFQYVLAILFIRNMYVYYLVSIACFSSYYILLEYYFQRTVGKFMTDSLVVNEYGERPDLTAICLRTAIRIIPFEAISFLWSDENRWWHDQWAGTYVISKDELSLVRRILAGEKPRKTDQDKWDEWHDWKYDS